MSKINKRNHSVTANVKFLAADLQTANPDGWLTITLIPTLAGKLTVVHDDGTNEDEGILNSDTDLAAGSEYSFSVPVPTSEDGQTRESVNFKFSVTTTLKKLIIAEGA